MNKLLVRKIVFLFLCFNTLIISKDACAQPAPPASVGTAAAAAGNATDNSNSGDIGAQIFFNVEKYTLSNGLTVLLHEDHSAPVVSYQTWFRIGSKYEEPGLTGMAHLFEHMMFKGAKRYSGEEFDHLLEANGATNNAFTTQDYTGYYENLPSGKLELVIDLESDRMQNLRIDDANLKSEREVVKEERRYRVDNNPAGILHEGVFATAFRVHPYRWPVIGYMTDIDNVTVAIAQKFHTAYYAPNNAVVIVVGDFNSANAKKLIQKYYGAIPSQVLPKKEIPAEPEQHGARTQTLVHDVQNVQFSTVYHSPKAGADEGYALDLLANILGNGDSSRLYQRLVYKDQLANSVYSTNYSLQDSGLFEVFVGLKPHANFARAQKAALGEIWRLRNILVSPTELQKAKNQTMKSYVDGLKTAHGKAESLAINEIYYGDYSQLFKDLDRYNRVTAEEVMAAANKFLQPEQSTLVVLKPGPSDQEKDGK